MNRDKFVEDLKVSKSKALEIELNKVEDGLNMTLKEAINQFLTKKADSYDTNEPIMLEQLYPNVEYEWKRVYEIAEQKSCSWNSLSGSVRKHEIKEATAFSYYGDTYKYSITEEKVLFWWKKKMRFTKRVPLRKYTRFNYLYAHEVVQKYIQSYLKTLGFFVCDFESECETFRGKPAKTLMIYWNEERYNKALKEEKAKESK